MLDALEVVVYFYELLTMFIHEFNNLLAGFGLDVLEILDLLVEEEKIDLGVGDTSW